MPDEITKLTVEQANAYLEHMRVRDVPPMDVTVYEIRQALFAWLGIKEQPEATVDDAQKAGFKTAKVTDEEMKAWYAAKMPEINKFLKEYRHARRD